MMTKQGLRSKQEIRGERALFSHAGGNVMVTSSNPYFPVLNNEVSGRGRLSRSPHFPRMRRFTLQPRSQEDLLTLLPSETR